MPSKRIAIFAATAWEMSAVQSAFPPGIERRVGGRTVFVCTVGDREYCLAQTGVGLEKAGQSAAQLLDSQSFSLVVSTGFACALIAADIGALLVGREVVYCGNHGDKPSEVLDVPGDERDLAVTSVENLVPSEHIGRFVSTDHIIGSAREKQRFALRTQAIGLDMESSALAAEAQRAQVPFVIIRSVSDLLDEDLPLDFNLFLRPTGWLKGIETILAAPSCLLGLGRLRRQSLVAAETLTSFFRSYVAAMATDRPKKALSPI
ncbi:MAG: phosphorylase family protein [Nitrospiraceae bacterium]